MTDILIKSIIGDKRYVAPNYLKDLAEMYKSDFDNYTFGEVLQKLNKDNFEFFLSAIDRHDLFEYCVHDNVCFIYRGFINNKYVRNFLINYGIIGDTELYKSINGVDESFVISIDIFNKEIILRPGIHYFGTKFDSFNLNDIPFEDMRLLIASYATTYSTGA